MPPAKKQLLEVGAIVNIEKNGRTIPSVEVLDYDDKFVKFRWNLTISPQTEIVLVPWSQVEAIGLVGER